jgi:hypothetical protein
MKQAYGQTQFDGEAPLTFGSLRIKVQQMVNYPLVFSSLAVCHLFIIPLQFQVA